MPPLALGVGIYGYCSCDCGLESGGLVIFNAGTGLNRRRNMRGTLKMVALAAIMLSAWAAGAEGGDYIEQLDAARPAAAALFEQTATEWRAAPSIVKDVVGFNVFRGAFPRKKEMSQNDMIACMDAEASKADAKVAVLSLFKSCAGLN
jgi:hypothetical protein